MMTTRHRILLALLVLQLALVGYLYWPAGNNPPASIRFFPGLDPARVTRLTIQGQDKQVSLSRQGQGWVIDQSDGLPADPDKVAVVLKRLATLSSSRLVAQTKASHNRFQVGDRYHLKLTLTTADGKNRTIFLGTAPSYKTMHVRAQGDDRVYLVSNLSAWQVPVEQNSWWLREYVRVAPEQLTAIQVENRHGRFRLLRQKPGGNWRLAGQPDKPLDPKAVQGFVSAASRIALTDYLGRKPKKAYGLDKPLAVLTLETPDATITVQAGPKDAKTNSQVLKSSASPFYVRASSFLLAPVFERKASELLATTAAKPAPRQPGS